MVHGVLLIHTEFASMYNVFGVILHTKYRVYNILHNYTGMKHAMLSLGHTCMCSNADKYRVHYRDE